jgi:hypothetical protein
MAHTPGPWGIQPDEHGGPSDTVYAYEDQQQEVAKIVSGVSADRHLIAAAPEMLAALKMCVEIETSCDGRVICFCDDPEIARHGRCYVCTVRDAIAKAEGRE